MVLSRPHESDWPLYALLFGVPEIVESLGPVDTRRLFRSDLEHWSWYGWGPWLVFEDDVFAGRGGLHQTDVGGRASVEILYAIMPWAWGRGLATAVAQRAVEQARVLDLPEVVGYTATTNAASRRVLQKVGIRFERQIELGGQPHWFGRLELASARA